jgi:hypothetical protein
MTRSVREGEVDMVGNLASLGPLRGARSGTMLASRGWGEDGTEFSPFASVLGTAGAERCQAGHAPPRPSPKRTEVVAHVRSYGQSASYLLIRI